jgi:hypothetical protein
MTMTTDQRGSFDPIKITIDGYTLRFDWSAYWVQVSITPTSGPTNYMRLEHETFEELRAALAALPQAQAVPTRDEAARIIDPAAFAPHGITGDEDWHPNDQRLQQESALRKADAILALPQAQADGWQDIASVPTAPVQVEFFYGDGVAWDHAGNEISMVIEPYRDERREIGYWDGNDWHHCGTGHRVNEFGDDPPEWIPTHWRPLPAPPVIAEQRG